MGKENDRMIRRKVLICFVFSMILSFTLLVSFVPGIAASPDPEEPQHPTGLNWAYGLRVGDPENDTQEWSWNASVFLNNSDRWPPQNEWPAPYNETLYQNDIVFPPPLLRYGSTAEWDNETGEWIPNAPFDAARDLTGLWVTWNEERIVFRIYVRDLVNNDSLLIGAHYEIFLHYYQGWSREAQLYGRTWTPEAVPWLRSIGIKMENSTDRSDGTGGLRLSSWMKGPAWSTPDTSRTPAFPTGNMTVAIDFTDNYVEASAPWEDFIEKGVSFPTYMNITVMSFKQGEWWGDFLYREAFDPQAPGTSGHENDYFLAAGPDAADVMPGDQSEIDWTWSNITADMNGILYPEASVEGWYNVTFGPYAPMADFARVPFSPRPNQTVSFDASASGGAFAGDFSDPDPLTTFVDAPIVAYEWDFGDGNTYDHYTPYASHKYTAEGNYTVTLTVTANDVGTPKLSELGLDKHNISKTIEVSLKATPPAADFDYSPPSPYTGEAVTFNASASLPGWNGTAEVPIANYTWDFGDGSVTTVTENITTHTYSTAGTYTVNLTVTCQDDSVLTQKNITFHSTSQGITVRTAPDTDAPTITDVVQNPVSTEVDANETVTVTAINVTDNVEVDEVLLRYRTDSGAFTNITMSLVSGTNNYTGQILGKTAGTQVTYKVFANDTTGNPYETSDYSYTVKETLGPSNTWLWVGGGIGIAAIAIAAAYTVMRRKS